MTATKRTKRTPAAARSKAASRKPVSPLQAQMKSLRSGAKAAYARALEARDAMATGAQDARKAVMAGADEARTRTVEAVSQLEKVFEHRVSKAISKLGVPSASDIRALTRQVAELQHSVEQLNRSRSRARARA